MIWVVVIFTFFLSSCEQRPQVRHYTEITIEAPAMPANPHVGMDMSSFALPSQGDAVQSSPYSWTLPKGWKHVPGKGMRLASFHLISDPEAIDCSIVSLGGMAGGLDANLRRWMGQIGIESSDADLSTLIASASTLKVKAGAEGKVFDFTTIQKNADDKSMVVVMVSINESTVFVKMTGTVKTVNLNKADFFALAQSIESK